MLTLNRVRAGAVVAVVACLSACGGGGQNPPAAPEPPASVAPTEAEANGEGAGGTGKLPKALVGGWKGTISQDGEKYPAVVTLEAGEAGDVVGASSYRTLGCKGELTLLNGGDDVVVSEVVDNDENCIDVELRLAARKDGRMTYKAYLTGEDAPIAAGVLTKTKKKK
jgi:hypothetical protein